MTIQTATPYFILNGRAEQAMALYERALGASTAALQRFGDVDKSCPAARRDLVMHAELRIGNAKLMLSDGEGPDAGPLAEVGTVRVAIDFDDAGQMRRCFDALAATGSAVHPIFTAPWGALFGVVRDELGVSWMFNCAQK
jgi:PhnB protein